MRTFFRYVLYWFNDDDDDVDYDNDVMAKEKIDFNQSINQSLNILKWKEKKIQLILMIQFVHYLSLC